LKVEHRKVKVGPGPLSISSFHLSTRPMPLRQKIQQLVDELALVDDPHERLTLVIDRAKKIPPLAPVERIDGHRVRGCVSVVWLVGEVRDGRCVFRSDAESPIVRGLVALLCECFSGFTPAEIVATDADPLTALDLTKNLSPTRRNGLAAARQAIHTFARTHL
jgi:cysteine desulfuration protein SufE